MPLWHWRKKEWDSVSTIFATELLLERLHAENIEEAIRLAEEIFPHDISHLESPGIEYRASLNPELYSSELATLGLDFQQHWVLQTGERAVALTGLQHKIGDLPHIVWLGWFCVAASERRRKLGSRLLRWTTEVARALGYREMRLWTTTLAEESRAQVLYERFGFRIFCEEVEFDGTRRLYRTCSL